MNYACDREGFTCDVKVDASIHYEASDLYTASTRTHTPINAHIHRYIMRQCMRSEGLERSKTPSLPDRLAVSTIRRNGLCSPDP